MKACFGYLVSIVMVVGGVVLQFHDKQGLFECLFTSCVIALFVAISTIE